MNLCRTLDGRYDQEQPTFWKGEDGHDRQGSKATRPRPSNGTERH